MSKLRRYILPGLIFQSVIIAGGYGTGKELVEFFMPFGSLGGLMSMCLITFVFWAVVCAVTFEFARVFQTFNYKSMFKELLGPGWILYEICYIVLLMIVLAVVAATSGANFHDVFGLSSWYGIIIVSVCIMLLVIKGTGAIETFLAYWSYLLYAVYIVFLVICFKAFGDSIQDQFMTVKEVNSGWAFGGAKYAFYNLGIIPAVLFATRDAESRKEAVGSGLIAGAIGIIPAILLFVAMAGLYNSGIKTAEVPVHVVFDQLNMPWLEYTFQIVLLGTLIETGSGFIKAVSDRFELKYTSENRPVPKGMREIITIGCVIIGVAISQFGLTGLIAKGYGTITWGFFILYVVPMLTIGVYKIAKAPKR
ncbi:MAG: hypothetical protein CSB24_05775 [Deltaproteobacteria bacterium]|nr:MAG: hypothetical protein CSB24_05775 [Deltaproteobacteria bacterium]